VSGIKKTSNQDKKAHGWVKRGTRMAGPLAEAGKNGGEKKKNVLRGGGGGGRRANIQGEVMEEFHLSKRTLKRPTRDRIAITKKERRKRMVRGRVGSGWGHARIQRTRR